MPTPTMTTPRCRDCGRSLVIGLDRPACEYCTRFTLAPLPMPATDPPIPDGWEYRGKLLYSWSNPPLPLALALDASGRVHHCEFRRGWGQWKHNGP